MEALKSSFLNPTPLNSHPSNYPLHLNSSSIISCSISPDPWSLSDGNNNKPKPKSKNPKNPLSDDNARRIIKAKARYLSALRRNQGSRALTPNWIKRSPEQMIQYLEDDRNGHLYGRHVVAAIQRVRSLSGLPDGSYDMRRVMSSFVTKLTFREMCTVLKEQRNWRQVRDFLAWMKLQLTYRPSVIVYTLVLRTYGQAGKIKLAEETFLEMLESGCEPDEVACGTMLCAYAKWGRHKSMLSFYSAVQERGITLSVAVYNFMLSSLQKKSLHQSVSQVWRQMIASGVAPDHFTYTVVINSLVKTGLTDEAFMAFEEMKSMGFVPEEATYSLLITLSSKKGIQDEGSRLYEDMRQQKLVPSNFTCASLLSMYYRSGNYSKALSLFSEMERYKVVADEVIYGLLIRIYGKLGLYEDAMKTFQEIENSGMLSDDKTYITMAKVHLNAGNCEKALEVMEKMRSRNVKFSRFANIVMLQCYVMKKDTEGAEVTLQTLSETGFPDCSSCTNMLTLYMKLGLNEKAKEFIIKMRKNQVKFDKVLLKAVVKVYCKENMLNEGEQMIKEIISRNGLLEDDNHDGLRFVETISMGINGEFKRLEEEADLDSLDPMAFELLLTLFESESKMEEILKLLLKTGNGLFAASQVVNNFMKEGLTLKAETLFDLLLKLGCKPEMSTCCCMIHLYGKQNRMEKAKKVCAVVSSSETRKHLYNTMINVFVKSGKVNEAYVFYQEENKKGNDIGDVAISMLVNSLTSCGKHREAGNVINDCFLKDMELDTVAYNTFIKAMLDAGRLNFAGSIYERMLTNGVAPSIQTINTMITVHGRSRNLDKAIEMFNNARINLDEKAYTNMISYYGKAGRSGEASILFKQMQEEGIKPGQVSYNIMMNVYATGGLYKEAEQVFRSMKRDGYPPDSFTYLALVRAYTSTHKYTEAEEAITSLMEKQGISASCAHYNILLSAYAKAGLVDEVERVFYELLITRSGLSPDVGCYGTMIRLYLDYGYVEKGIDLFESIHGSVKPDRFIMSAGVHLYRSAGLGVKAQGVLSCMNSLGIPFLNNLEIGSKIKLVD